jgi:hypothetical protein
MAEKVNGLCQVRAIRSRFLSDSGLEPASSGRVFTSLRWQLSNEQVVLGQRLTILFVLSKIVFLYVFVPTLLHEINVDYVMRISRFP